jgi:class 3 adenylate cyclase
MQRKLAAILSADVVGYSGLMERDEAGTMERLKANRAGIFQPHVATHGGRVFNLLGDGALVEFPAPTWSVSRPVPLACKWPLAWSASTPASLKAWPWSSPMLMATPASRSKSPKANW